jgi:peptidoglycan hydrolase-like protein with peptidoglycan-binding domain
MKTWLRAVAVVLALSVSPMLAQGGADVERVQKALQQNGHDPGPIDGVNGPRTTSALKAYQKAQGLEPTGQLDDATLAKLGAPARSASQTQTGGDARPSPTDPAKADKTGANVGEGASYSRSTQK